MPVLLLHVATTWPLPGLGLLALPAGPTPNLGSYALHTALAVEAVGADGERHAAIATVEEVTRPNEPNLPARGLLLDFGKALELLPGTAVWLSESNHLTGQELL